MLVGYQSTRPERRVMSNAGASASEPSASSATRCGVDTRHRRTISKASASRRGASGSSASPVRPHEAAQDEATDRSPGRADVDGVNRG
jgi:hypothetical protein